MRRLTLAALLPWCLVAAALAKPPLVQPITIDGPETAVVGELVRLKVVGEFTSVVWAADPPTLDFEGVEGGGRAFFSGRQPGLTKFWLAAVDATGQVHLTHLELQVGEIGPEPEPDPPDPDPPPEPGRRWVIIVEESTQRTPQQAALIVGPGRDQIDKYLADKKHPKLNVADKDAKGNAMASLAPYIRLASDELPACFIVADESGKVLFQGPLPDSAATVIELVKEHGG